MARLGLPPAYTLDDLRTKPLTWHGFHPDTLLTDGGAPNLTLVLHPGLSGLQSRALLRDIERAVRQRATEESRLSQQLQQQQRNETSHRELQLDEAELQLLTTRLYTLDGRLHDRVAAIHNAAHNNHSTAQPSDGPSSESLTDREKRMIDATHSPRPSGAPRQSTAMLRKHHTANDTPHQVSPGKPWMTL